MRVAISFEDAGGAHVAPAACAQWMRRNASTMIANVVLVAMFVVHAFFLVPLLLVPLAASALFNTGRQRWFGAGVAAIALLGAEALLVFDNQAQFNDFKAIYAPLHTPDARVVASVLSPRGDYQLLDDFTERVDTDISNNAGMLGVPGPPRTLGLYRDGHVQQR